MLKLLFTLLTIFNIIGIVIAIKLCFIFKKLKKISKSKYAKAMADILNANSCIMVIIGIIVLGSTIKRFFEYPNELELSIVLPIHLIVTILFVSAQGLFYWLVEKKNPNDKKTPKKL